MKATKRRTEKQWAKKEKSWTTVSVGSIKFCLASWARGNKRRNAASFQ